MKKILFTFVVSVILYSCNIDYEHEISKMTPPIKVEKMIYTKSDTIINTKLYKAGTGKVVLKDSNQKTLEIPINPSYDGQYGKGLYNSYKEGDIIVIDQNNNTFQYDL